MQWQILALLARVEERRGRPSDAAVRQAQAVAIITTIAEQISDPVLKGSFMNMPVVRQLLETQSNAALS
jgi:hypothetical protein